MGGEGGFISHLCAGYGARLGRNNNKIRKFHCWLVLIAWLASSAENFLEWQFREVL